MKINITEQKITTILRPTGINLAPYVINPYQGCQMGCLFCYAQFSKAAQKEKSAWGEHVKVKINASEILEKEIQTIKPQKVLIGSITEPFQPAEQKYHITRSILQILHKYRIKYVIMSRSILIPEEMCFMNKDLCEGIYFTIDMAPDAMKKQLEPCAVNIKKGVSVVNKLCSQGYRTIAYCSPVMPFFKHELPKLLGITKEATIEFELLNFQMAGIETLIKAIQKTYPEIAEKYRRLCQDKKFYDKVVKETTQSIRGFSGKRFSRIKIHSHVWKDYFKNIYQETVAER